MADFTTVASAFVKFYYDTFDRNRLELAPLYRPTSMLSFEGMQFVGISDISEKLVNLPFKRVKHNVSTIDAQPTAFAGGSILVAVTGALLIDEESNPQMFSQTFHLIPEGNSYWVSNDVFRLNYA
ncbi:hypothetical protein BDF14DRAFT_1082714 [Spinellus fusiger]|nr:hypothetical protein BDF14DRAFT_1082714 [Spinellus fusiger]